MSKDDSVGHEGRWTRDDLPGVYWPGIHGEPERQGAEKALDAVVDHLNVHHPKVDDSFSDRVWKRAYESMRSERDAAVARAEQAENARDTAATRAEQLEKALAASRDAHQRSADAHMEWKARAEAAEANNADAKIDGDPAVHVVRESDLPAARVDGDCYVVASAKGDYRWPQHGPSWWAGRAQDALIKAARYTALARLAADREAAVDPAEDVALIISAGMFHKESSPELVREIAQEVVDYLKGGSH